MEVPLTDNDWSEHYVKRGDPSKPTYYIIRRKWRAGGIFAYFNSVAGQIRYALSNDWIPVVDMQNYQNVFFQPEELGKENAWEYFFQQPLRIGLEEAYSGENIILSSTDKMFPPYARAYYYDGKSMELTEWRMLVKLGLLKIKNDIMKEILEIQAKLFAPTDRVLGVKLRGTDYVSIRHKYHPIQPPPEYVRDVILKKVREWKCNKIFLVTEDKNILQFFKITFGDGFGTFCVTIDKEYKNYKNEYILDDAPVNRENDSFLNQKDYVTEMVILSKCNSFITSMCNGSCAVMMLADKLFENSMAIDLGIYGVFPVDWRKLIGK